MTLPDTIRLTSGMSRSSGISSASIVAGSNYLGVSIDNAVNQDVYASVEVVWQCGTAPTADAVIEVYLLYAMDGSNYEDGAGTGTGSGDVDPKTPIVGAVPVYADTAAHRHLVRNIPLEPYPMKVLLKSEIDQTAVCTVNMKTYNDQTVD
jgi:hypothetical protein